MDTKFKIGQKVYDSVFFGSAEGTVKDIKNILNKTVVELLKENKCIPELSATNQQTLF